MQAVPLELTVSPPYNGRMERPSRNEYGEYFQRYVELVPDVDILTLLATQRDEFVSFLRSLGSAMGEHRYAPEKWSLKEVVGHIIDVERVFVYRALAFARGDATALPGFEQDDYVAATDYSARTLDDLAEEFSLHRSSSLAMFRSFDDDAWQRCGTASDTRISARAVPYILAGHVTHHMNVIRERYL